MKNHEEQYKFLSACYKKKFPHSWIFHGPKGIGKYEFTIEFIKNFNKIKNSNNNIFEINNPDNPALLEDIRELISKVHLTNSSFADLKTFFLIHNVETMNLNCINALLKTIEEPPENTIIIIFSNNLRNIPKTILSRCLKLKFKISMSNFFIKKNDSKENFLFCNFNPQIFKILNNEEGEEIKKKK